MSIIKVCCNCVLLLYPIIQVFFLYFGTVTTKVWLRLSVLWDFFNFYTLLLIVLIANLVVPLRMSFEFAALVTPRIINFRLAPASASLRLMRLLRIYYSRLCGEKFRVIFILFLFSVFYFCYMCTLYACFLVILYTFSLNLCAFCRCFLFGFRL